MDKKELGIYIHIPFCKQKCYYCDFISFANMEEKQQEYVDALKREIQSYSKKIKSSNLDGYKVTTIYIGGGTPSYIDSKFVVEILDEIKKSLVYELEKSLVKGINDYSEDLNQKDTGCSEIEITIEVNPGTVTKQKLQDYRDARN